MSRLRKGGIVAATAASLIGGFEGIRQTSYQDVVGVWTVCAGHTEGVRRGDRYSMDECKAMLIRDLDSYANGVEACTRVNLPDRRYVAFVSFAFNLGVPRYCKSIAPLVNAGKTQQACDRLLRFDHAGGVPFPGLTRRRQQERQYCMADL